MANVSPARLARPQYIIDTPSKERELQRANHFLTKVVVAQRAVVDCGRPGNWVPGVGSLARALRLAKERSKDRSFQAYVRKYVDYDPIGDADLRKLQELQQPPRNRPTSAASSRCSFGSGRSTPHLQKQHHASSSSPPKSQPKQQQRPSSATVRNDSIISPDSYMLPRSFVHQSSSDTPHSLSSSPSTPNNTVAFATPSDADLVGSGSFTSMMPSAAAWRRQSSRSARLSVVDSSSMAITSSAPFKVWMDATWEDPSGGGSGISNNLKPAQSTTSLKDGGKEQQQQQAAGGRRRENAPPTACPPVIDLRQGGAAKSLISSAFLQAAVPQQENARPGIMQSSKSPRSSPTTAGTNNNNNTSAAAAVPVVVPREYGVSYRAHQHLTFHLPQPGSADFDSLSNAAVAGDSFAGGFSSVSSSASEAKGHQQQPQHLLVSMGATGAAGPTVKAAAMVEPDSVAAEEKRLLANYGYRGSSSNSQRQESRSGGGKKLRE